ncbi:hypothetical protein HHK36_000979 [Tetracentron sinense]|uniref:DUF4283 domain-containing protein n=1 Tax=Tetracentron sinense TaxID=13715 RepID=A0A834ZV51_TETSI|nr:hypothetical protein HHK36_000979 [Tetracentron sinense]
MGCIQTYSLASGVFIFNFENVEFKQRVLDQGPWYWEKKPLVLRPWDPDVSLEKSIIKKIPIWVKFPCLKLHLWNDSVLGRIASTIGLDSTARLEAVIGAQVEPSLDPKEMNSSEEPWSMFGRNRRSEAMVDNPSLGSGSREVHELHRLYRIQKTLMEEFNWKEFDRYTSWTENTESTPIPFQNYPIYKPLAEENTFSILSMMGSMQTANQHSLEQVQETYSKFQQRHLNLRLPADAYISRVGPEHPHKMNLKSYLEDSMEVKNFLHSNHVSDQEELKLCLNIEESTSKKGDSSRPWYNRETYLVTQDVVHLEESIESVSKDTARPVTSLTLEAPINVVETNEAQIPVLSDSSFSRIRMDLGHRLFTSHSLADHTGSFQEQKPFSLDTGLGECDTSRSFVDLCTRKQQSSSYNTAHADRNRVQLDESSFYSEDPLVTFPSPTASPPVVIHGLADKFHKGTQSITTFRSKTNNSCSDEFSDVRQQDNAAYSALTDTRGKDSSTPSWVTRTRFKENSGSEVGAIDLESVPEDPVELCEDFGNRGVSRANVDLLLGTPNSFLHDNQTGTSVGSPTYTSLGGTILPQIAGDAEIGQVNCEKSEEETVSSSPFHSNIAPQTEHCKEYPAACNSDCITDNNSSGIKDLKSQAEDKHDSAFDRSVTTQLGSQVPETHASEQYLIVESSFYARTQEKSKFQNKSDQQKKAIEVETCIQRAAESLIKISLETSRCSQDWFPKAGSNELENGESKQPQYSSDSFESITLRLTESSVDDYSVSSRQVEVNETDKKGCPYKLRRGRRLKDFQREILPGLASLSRHDICEDINSIGEIVNLKELRKNRSRKVGGGNWCSPVRSRRSRFSYVDGRNYS